MSNSIKPTNEAISIYSEKPTTEKSKTLHPEFWKNIFIGGAAATLTVPILQPFIYFKNMTQIKALQKEMIKSSSTAKIEKISWNPIHWYAGARIFTANFVPAISIQMGVKAALAPIIGSFNAAIIGGAASAMVVCPFEGIMTQQQITKQSLTQTISHIFRTYGFKGFYRGFSQTAIREGSFTLAYSVMGPFLADKFKDMGCSKEIAPISGGIIAGAIGAIFSQSFDTSKTQLQADFSIKKPLFKEIFQTKSYSGLRWRITLTAVACVAIPFSESCIKTAIQKIEALK